MDPLLKAQQEAKLPVAWRTFDGEGNWDFRDYEMRTGTKYSSWHESKEIRLKSFDSIATNRKEK